MHPQQAQEQFGKAILLHQQGKLHQAEAIYRKILGKFPQLDPVLSNLGGILFARQKYDEALSVLDKALSINPTNMDAFVNRAAVLRALNRKEEALDAYLQITKMDARNGGAHYNYANVLMENGRPLEAEKSFREALRLSPGLHQAHHNLGFLLKDNGRLAESVAEFRQAIALNPHSPHYQVNLGNVLNDLGRLHEAEAAYDEAIALDKDYLLGYQARGRLLLAQGRTRNAIRDLRIAKEIAPKNVDTLVLLGNALDDLGESEAARKSYEAALAQDPGNPVAQRNLSRIRRRGIPAWHFTMLADDARNDGYQKAIEAAVKKGDTVLDIGTGSGLLAMMAARAGAGHVYACEMNSRLAKVARDIIADNGLDGRITVFDRHSGELVMGDDISQQARIVVSEIVDAALLGEGVLPSLRHAKQELARKDAVIIPAGATVWAQLISMPQRRKVNPLRTISGFDLSRFDQFRESDTFDVVRAQHEPLHLLSEPVRVVDFDFADLPPAVGDEAPEELYLHFEATETDSAQGILLWFDLHLNEEITVSTSRDGELLHWGQAVGFFPEDIPVQKGKSIEVKLLRTDTNWMLG